MSFHDLGEAHKAREDHRYLRDALGFQRDYLGYFIKEDNNLKWTMKNGQTKQLKNMTNSHIQNTINLLKDKMGKNQYISDRIRTLDSIDILSNELERRISENDNSADQRYQAERTKKNSKKQIKIQDYKEYIESLNLGSNVQMICGCGMEYTARKADLTRGWGRSCSKKCAHKVKNGWQNKGELKEENT